MSIARRPAKWRRDSRSLAGQDGFVHRATASSAARNVSGPADGALRTGMTNFFSRPVLFSFIGPTTYGMTSPLRSIRT